ncbi:HtrA protease/chaperone protein [Desulfocucumis palustris]|uniref:HtrA protease/chaperone protein n=1 Tax=Desulfocucumis palustris TaxID=1898651 RepID=A0A2L2X8S9_9FIRM|nr:trypsin-like peptidase domain-containing protein [Desulfocucumis palustris]GBF32637.1 HtrA protease/chaperone protein [Desulfocucumis palustris]
MKRIGSVIAMASIFIVSSVSPAVAATTAAATKTSMSAYLSAGPVQFSQSGQPSLQPAQSQAPGSRLNTVEVAKQEKAVVRVVCGNDLSAVQGSGVIVDTTGLIVTNYHVVAGQTHGKVELSNGSSFPILGVVGYNEDIDLAVLKIQPGEPLPAAQIRDSETVALGEEVMAIGSPLGLQNTLSTGIVSGKRVIGGNRKLQITAAIDHGSSGGGLFDKDGKLIGITDSGYGEGSLNFAIPINEVAPMLRDGMVTPLSQLKHTVIDLTKDKPLPSANLSYAKYKDYLTKNHMIQEFGNNKIQFGQCFVYENKGTAYVLFEMNTLNYNLWLKTLKAGDTSDIIKFVEAVGVLTKTLYPQKNIAVVITLYDHFKDKPDWCPAEYLNWNSKMKQWEIFMTLLLGKDSGGSFTVEFF